jgi:hypothetical protein
MRHPKFQGVWLVEATRILVYAISRSRLVLENDIILSSLLEIALVILLSSIDTHSKQRQDRVFSLYQFSENRLVQRDMKAREHTTGFKCAEFMNALAYYDTQPLYPPVLRKFTKRFLFFESIYKETVIMILFKFATSCVSSE